MRHWIAMWLHRHNWHFLCRRTKPDVSGLLQDWVLLELHR